MKVIKDFFCIKEKKNYKKGDEYTGSRKDIDFLLEKPKAKRKTKENKQLPLTKENSLDIK